MLLDVRSVTLRDAPIFGIYPPSHRCMNVSESQHGNETRIVCFAPSISALVTLIE